MQGIRESFWDEVLKLSSAMGKLLDHADNYGIGTVVKTGKPTTSTLGGCFWKGKRTPLDGKMRGKTTGLPEVFTLSSKETRWGASTKEHAPSLQLE